ncbi:hypothetical protein [Kitasatospora sp. A2-31]|uniref:hypothetical protein n=1 Tax=Kitasatospora sp. A2-31 TaxID=2916414 RepID=UPI001EE80EE7|nr:hypothetical protein [Kitasatospora sp. A2-31]MCG6493457.1 hypothetical protein [Kitasatospora sp. A2-31]
MSDLVALQQAALTAEQAMADYCLTVQTRRREQHPDDVIARCTWDDAEQAELDRLRDAYLAAAAAVVAHPDLAAARERGEHYKVWSDSKTEAKKALAAAA